MPASEALNETRLPRAVRIRSSKLDEQYGKGKRPDPADPSGTQATPPSQDAVPPSGPAEPPAAPAVPAAVPAASVADLVKENERLTQVNRSVTSRITIIAEERRAEKAAWKQERDQLLEQIRDLQAKQPPAEIALEKHFSPEQIEALGETQCRAMVVTAQRIAQESINEAVEAAVKPLREQQAATQQSATEDADQRYFARLAELVPNWREVNGSDEWKAWLAIEEGDTGVERDELLKRHHDNRDATKVAKLFTRYLNETAPQPPAPAPAPTPPVAPRSNGAQPSGDTPDHDTGNSKRLTAPSPKEISDFHKRAATKRPGQHGFVTDAERAEFESRLKLLSRR
jgi:hypothetical protein